MQEPEVFDEPYKDMQSENVGIAATNAARKALGVKGFCAINKGSPPTRPRLSTRSEHGGIHALSKD